MKEICGKSIEEILKSGVKDEVVRAAAQKCLEAVPNEDDNAPPKPFDGIIPAAAVQSGIDAAAAASGGRTITPDELADALVCVASNIAIVPVSTFRVGAVGRLSDGCLVLGANMEFGGEDSTTTSTTSTTTTSSEENVDPEVRGPLCLSLHAEQCVIGFFLSAYPRNTPENRQVKLVSLSVSDSPCGHCRQCLVEQCFYQSTPPTSVMVRITGKEPISVDALLPHAFTPASLGVTQIQPTASFAPPRGGLPGPLASLAVPAVITADDVSRAPHTGAIAAVALCVGPMPLSDANIFTGAYIESAAFNPSILPLTLALARVRVAGRSFSDISNALLVEAPNKKISCVAITRHQLALVVPNTTRLTCVILEH